MRTAIALLLACTSVLAACTDHDPARTARVQRVSRVRVDVRGSRTRKGEGEEHEAIVPTRAEGAVAVTLRMYDSPREVVHACLKMGAWPGWTVDQVLRAHPAPGCNAFDNVDHTCTIHTLRPRYVEDDDRMENLGHEALHCFEGAYHQQN